MPTPLTGLRTLVLCCVWVAGSLTASAQLKDSRTLITVLQENSGTANRELLRAAVKYDEELRRLVGRRPASLPIYLVPDGDRRSYERSLLVYGLNEKAAPNPVARQYELLRALIYRLSIEINHKNGLSAPETLPNWIIAAVHWRLLHADMPSTTRTLFPVIRIQVDEDKLVPWKKLVDGAPGPDQPIIYLLYSDACACLYAVLERVEPRLLVALLSRNDPERSPSAALANAFPDQLGGEQSQLWYAAQVEKLVHHLNEPDTYDQIRAKMQVIEKVTIMVPTDGGGYGVKQVLLDDVPEYLENYDYTRANIEEKMKDLITIMQDCPMILRESLAMYMQALGVLRTGDKVQFAALVKAARERFNHDLEQGKKIQAYLAELEQKTDPPAKRLFRYVNVLAPDLPLTPYQAQVSEYLNSLEERRQPNGVSGAEGK